MPRTAPHPVEQGPLCAASSVAPTRTTYSPTRNAVWSAPRPIWLNGASRSAGTASASARRARSSRLSSMVPTSRVTRALDMPSIDDLHVMSHHTTALLEIDGANVHPHTAQVTTTQWVKVLAVGVAHARVRFSSHCEMRCFVRASGVASGPGSPCRRIQSRRGLSPLPVTAMNSTAPTVRSALAFSSCSLVANRRTVPASATSTVTSFGPDSRLMPVTCPTWRMRTGRSASVSPLTSVARRYGQPPLKAW
jgi:hypothetical protein